MRALALACLALVGCSRAADPLAVVECVAPDSSTGVEQVAACARAGGAELAALLTPLLRARPRHEDLDDGGCVDNPLAPGCS